MVFYLLGCLLSLILFIIFHKLFQKYEEGHKFTVSELPPLLIIIGISWMGALVCLMLILGVPLYYLFEKYKDKELF